jgi:hypothetical protein
MDNTVQQLALESSEDVAVLREEYKELKDEAEILKKSAEKKLKHNKFIEKSCAEFESLIEDAMTWLEQKEETLVNCGALDLDTAMIVPVVHKHTVSTTKNKSMYMVKDHQKCIPCLCIQSIFLMIFSSAHSCLLISSSEL